MLCAVERHIRYVVTRCLPLCNEMFAALKPCVHCCGTHCFKPLEQLETCGYWKKQKIAFKKQCMRLEIARFKWDSISNDWIQTLGDLYWNILIFEFNHWDVFFNLLMVFKAFKKTKGQKGHIWLFYFQLNMIWIYIYLIYNELFC